MRIDEIVAAMQADLLPWVTTQKGKLSIAKDLWNVLEILCQGPQGLQVIVAWAGDSEEGGQDQEPLSTNNLEVVIGYNLGLDAAPDAGLVKSTVARPSLLKLVDDLRAHVLTLQFPEDETSQFLAYGGTVPVTMPNGIPLAAYRIRTRLTTKVETEETYRSTE